MKKALLLALLAFSTTALSAEGALQVGVVNFRKAVEESKMGKHEQESFEGMKKQMESIFKEKEDEFQKLVTKLRDDDFRDSQKPDALEKMEQQARQLGAELSGAQQQFTQALQQSNFKILQKLADVVSASAESVAKNKKLDLVINSDSSFYNKPELDITSDVIADLDRLFAEQQKETTNAPATLDLKK